MAVFSVSGTGTAKNGYVDQRSILTSGDVGASGDCSRGSGGGQGTLALAWGHWRIHKWLFGGGEGPSSPASRAGGFSRLEGNSLARLPVVFCLQLSPA